MAISSVSATLFPSLPLSNSSLISTKPIFSSFPLPSLNSSFKLRTLKPSHPPARTYAAAATLDSVETSDPLAETLDEGNSEAGGDLVSSGLDEAGVDLVSADSDEAGEITSPDVSAYSEEIAQLKIRVKLKSYWVPLIEDACKQIMNAATTTGAKLMGPVRLPTKRRTYCLLRSPHKHKTARLHFEIRTHQRLIDVYPNAQTIDALMLVLVSAGVSVEIMI